ncbi:hypothetical protein IVB18_49620 (plasmid) [Bradyrhizobium sp. 186]|uniref:ATP-binding protein n=1 Tax=Bradyrhizobium sp. 186 TaxID=2782654 RepID=UPI00205D0898|nr:hypothetical protein IVB18_49620 [Bradyrhizobium sp. 186]
MAKTDGVPLFVEELTKTVLESGLLREQGNCYELIGPLPPLAIPTTLKDSLMARLDRLAPVKEVAQIAACIGREFGHDLLKAVAPLDEDALQLALNELLEAELIFRVRGIPPDIGYSFKHALVQDIAHKSLLRSKRQQIHAGIAAHPAPCEPEDFVGFFRYPQPPGVIFKREQLKCRQMRRGHRSEAVTLGEVVDAGDDEPIASLQVLVAGGTAQDRHWTSPRRFHMRLAQANGRMFWLMRKKFFGSYFVLSSLRRRWLAP